MAKKIIVEGKDEFYLTCDKCGCGFTYELEDISLVSPTVYCPKCNKALIHPDQQNSRNSNL